MANKKTSGPTKKASPAKKTPTKTNAANKPKTTAAKKPAPKTETPEKKELDEMIAAMQKENEKVATQAEPKKSSLGAILIVLVLILLIICGGIFAFQKVQENKVRGQAEELIGYLGGDLTLNEISDFKKENGVYSFTFNFQEYPETDFTSYMTKDGKIFFVDGYEVEELKAEMAEMDTLGSADPSPQSCDEVNKSATPELAAYIVADCPYGTQMQSVMVEAIKEAPALKDNFTVRYFFDEINDDGTVMAMHGEEEAKENLRQICIREEQPTVFWDYVECYAAGGSSDSCLTSANVNTSTVNACMSSTNRGIAFAKADNALAQQHMVSGSPTLVLNDNQTVAERNFGGRNAEGLKTIVCCSSDNALSFCSNTLSSAATAASGSCE